MSALELATPTTSDDPHDAAPARVSVARNSSLGIAGQLAIRVLSVMFGVAVIRRFGSESFGQYTAALAFVGLFSVLSDLGLGSWGVRAIAEHRERTGALVAQVAGIRLVLSAITCVVIVGCALLLYSGAQVFAVAVATGSLFLFSVNGALDMAWLGHERLDMSSLISVVNQLGFVTLGTVVLVLHGGVIALIVASLAAMVIATALSWRLAKRGIALTLVRPALRGSWSLIQACAPIGIVQISLLISYKADTVLLSIFRDDQTVGIYAVAYNIIFSLMLLSHSVNLALFPALSRVAADRVAATRLATQTMKYLLLVGIPLAVGGALLAPSLIVTLYTTAFLPSATVLRIVIWVLPLMFLTEFLGYYATAIHRERAASRAAFIMAGANVALNIVCLPRFGVWAAAIITVVTEIVFLGQYLWIVRDRDVPRIFIALSWRPILASGVMALLLAFLPLALPLAIASGVVVYGAALVLLGGVTRAELIAVYRRGASRIVPAGALREVRPHGASDA